MGKLELKDLYPGEIILLGNIIQRYEKLIESDIAGAYQLSKDALQTFNRFSEIKHDIKKKSTRGQDAALKNRLEEICKYLTEVTTHSRMVWKYGVENKRNNFEDM